MDEAIMRHVRSEHNLLIGERTAERIKIGIGSAAALDRPAQIEVKGRDLIAGVPRSVTLSDDEIRIALKDQVATIIRAIRASLEATPPELSADIAGHGIVLTGGGSLLKNLDRRISLETGLTVSIAENPLASVVLGAGKLLGNFRLLQKMSMN
jgi:rod shape-determining protein MreB